MADVPSTDDVRDIWVDYYLNPLPRAEGIALVPEYQEAFDAWVETIRADERDKVGEMGIRAARKGAAIAVTEWKAAFRAQILALPAEYVRLDGVKVYSVYRDDVLALIDGGSNG